MKSRKRPAGPDLTLFPFLAVLICTMGALIVLLVVVVQQARVTGGQERSRRLEQQRDQHQQLQQQLDDLRWKRTALAQAQQSTNAQLGEARLRLAHFEDHVRRLRLQLKALLDARDAQQVSDLDEAKLREELQAVQGELQRAQERLREEAEQQEAEPVYALIPYEGPQGTRRRPIYIECLSDRVVLQPEGIALRAADFRSPLGPGNPLAALLRAKSEYLRGLYGPDDHGTPYPLLIVRPGGADAYAACRQAMADWQAEFGYELIDESMRLAYPPADPPLVEQLKQVLELARARHQRQVAAAEAERAASGGALVGRTASGPSPSALSVSSEAAGRLPGSSDAAGDSGDSRKGPFGQASTAGGGRGTEPDAAGGPFAAGAEAGGDSLASGPAGRGGRTGGPGGGSAMASSGRAGVPGSAALPGGSPSSGGPAGGGQGHRSGADGAETTGMGTERTGNGSGQPADAGAAAEAGAAAGGAGRPDRAAAAGGTTAGGGGQGAGAATATTGPQSGGLSAGSMPPAGMAAGSAGAATRPFSGMAGGSARGGAGTGGTGAAAQPAVGSPSMAFSATPAESMPSLARSRGANWGLPSVAREATGITRPIRLRAHQGAIELLPEPGSQQRLHRYDLTTDPVQAVDRLVHAIWERMASWGIAGYGAYWRPVLRVEVDEQGNEALRRLTELLEDSGLQIEREPS